MKLIEVAVHDLGTVITGKTPSTKISEYFDGDYLFVTPSDLNFMHYYCKQTETTITNRAKDKHKNQFIPSNSIMFTCIGNTIGKCAISSEECMTNQQINTVVPHTPFHAKFIYYLLNHHKDIFRGIGFSGGAATPIINKTAFSNVKLSAPQKESWEVIGDLLSSYDDLIENNRRRIELLEQSARLLYKEWFVHLRFPGHEHVKVVDGVPEGWKKGKIADISSYLNRGITPKYDDEGEFVVINQKCIRNRLLNLQLAQRQSKEYKIEKAIQLGDVLINSTGTGTLGRVAQCWEELEKCTVDTHVTIVRPLEGIGIYWFGYALMEFEKRFEDMGEGATNQKELKRDRISEVQLLIPIGTLMSDFDEYAKSIAHQIICLTKQNNQLVNARDLLLPRLMNGEIAV